MSLTPERKTARAALDEIFETKDGQHLSNKEWTQRAYACIHALEALLVSLDAEIEPPVAPEAPSATLLWNAQSTDGAVALARCATVEGTVAAQAATLLTLQHDVAELRHEVRRLKMDRVRC